MRRLLIAAAVLLAASSVSAATACNPGTLICPLGTTKYFSLKDPTCPNGTYTCIAANTEVLPKTSGEPAAPSVPARTKTSPSASSEFLFGARGTAVRNVQQQLISLGYLSADSATGYFGSLTRDAVRAFQRDRGIVSSGNEWTTGYGLVGPRTKAALFASSSALSVGAVATVPSAVPSQTTDIQSLVQRIAQLQAILTSLTGPVAGSINTTTATNMGSVPTVAINSNATVFTTALPSVTANTKISTNTTTTTTTTNTNTNTNTTPRTPSTPSTPSTPPPALSPKTYTYSYQYHLNPERGLAAHISADWNVNAGSASALEYWRQALKDVTVVLFSDPTAPSTGTLPEAQVTKDTAAMWTFRKLGKKAVLNIQHSTDSQGKVMDPQDIATQQQQIYQIAGIANQFPESVISVFVGFICGEYCGDVTTYKPVIEAFESYMVASIPISVRTPKVKYDVLGRAPASNNWYGSDWRIHFLNFCAAASPDDWGTFLTNTDRTNLATDMYNKLYGGELCWIYDKYETEPWHYADDARGTGYPTDPDNTHGDYCRSMMEYGSTYHLSYVLKDYNQAVFDLMKKKGCYQQFIEGLGYNLYLSEATIPASISTKTNGSNKISVTINNRGFAGVVFYRPVYAIVKDVNGKEVYRVSVNINLQLLGPNTTNTVAFNVDVPAYIAPGNYTLWLSAPDNSSILSKVKEAAMRFNSNLSEDENYAQMLGPVWIQ